MSNHHEPRLHRLGSNSLEALFLLLLTAAAGQAAPVILNEYNAVGSSKYLGSETPEGSTATDVFFGRVPGNGGDWCELVVVEDHVDLRGWVFDWAYARDSLNHGAGSLRVVADTVNDLRAGTIVTIGELSAADGGRDTDLTVDPTSGDWWIHLCTADPAVVTTSGVVWEDGLEQTLAAGAFRVNNDMWQLTIRDSTGTIVFGPAGEGAPRWQGPGINSTEIAQLRAEPSALLDPGAPYSDGTASTFGAPNTWGDGVSSQDFAPLRALVIRRLLLTHLEPLPDSGGWRVFWQSAPGSRYLLQRQAGDALGVSESSAWVDVAFARPDDSIAWADDVEVASASQRFYRVIVPSEAPPDAVVQSAPPSGFVADPAFVLLTTAAAGEVRYTLDGSEPTLRSARYETPLAVSGVQALRAAVFVPGHAPGPIASFLHVASNAFGLPTVALLTTASNLFDPTNGICVYPHITGTYWERPAAFVSIGSSDLPAFTSDVGIEIAGGASRDNNKKSFDVKWRTRYGANALDVPLFSSKPGVRPFRDLVLRGGATDAEIWNWSLLRDPLVHELYAEMDGAGSACAFVHLFLNNDYWGIYTLRERINEDYLAANLGATNPDLIKFEDEQPQLVTGDFTSWVALSNLFVTNVFATDEGLATAAAAMDLTNFTDYQILEIYAANLDWPQNNVYAWRDRTPEGRWRWVLWDADLTFNLAWWDGPSGAFDQSAHDTLAWAARDAPRPDLAPPWLSPADGREARGTLLWSTVYLRRLLEHPAYREGFLNRLADLLNTTLSTSNVLSRLDALVNQVAPEIRMETQRWEKLRAYPGQWDDNVESIREFARLRPDRLRGFATQFFALPGVANLEIRTSGGSGHVQVNSIVAPTVAWKGVYFQSVPVTVCAIPGAGHRFVQWQGASTATTAEVTLALPPEGILLEARFAPQP